MDLQTFVLFHGLKSTTIVIYFVAHIVLDTVFWNSFQSASVPFSKPPSFFEHFLTFWYHRLFQAHPVYFLPHV